MDKYDIENERRFTKNSQWVRADGAAAHEWYILRRRFYIRKFPYEGFMLFSSYGYCRIYINGKHVADYSERSYIFNTAYSLYNILGYLKEGINSIAVLYESTGDPKHDGILPELRLKMTATNKSHGASWWKFKKFAPATAPVSYYVSGCNNEQIYNARYSMPEAITLECDDEGFLPAVYNDKLDDTFYHLYHQSELQTAEGAFVSPVKSLSPLTFTNPNGCSLTLKASSELSVFFISAKAEKINIKISSGAAYAISVGGKPYTLGTELSCENGEAFIAVRTSGCDMLIENAESASVLLYDVRIPRIKRYPWNDPRPVQPEIPENTARAMEASGASELPQPVRARLTKYEAGLPGPLHFIKLRYTVPSDIKIPDNATDFTLPKSTRSSFILDFGTERVGTVTFKVTADEGTKIETHAFEMMTENGIRYMGARQTCCYICGEDGSDEFTSLVCTGLRYLYVSVSNSYSPVHFERIGINDISYKADTENAFSCGDDRINRIYKMCADTAKVCMLDSYVDCPGYEQNIWTGDARVTGNVNLSVIGDYKYDEHYLSLIADSLSGEMKNTYRRGNQLYEKKSFLTCGTFPTYPDGCIPIWSFMWMLHAYDNFMHSGSMSFLETILPAVRENLARCSFYINSRGLFEMNGAWNLIEWADNDLKFYGEATANSMLLALCFDKAAYLAEKVDKKTIAAKYQEAACALREAVNTYCYDENLHAYVDTVRDEYSYKKYVKYISGTGRECESYEKYLTYKRVSVQTNTIAVLTDCATGDRKNVLRFLIDNVTTGDYKPGTPSDVTGEQADEYVKIGSPFFMFFALETLYKTSHPELAFDVIKRDWGKMADDGMATCVENFRTESALPRSAAHGWSSSPAIYFMSEILGVKPVEPGYTEFSVNPQTYGLDGASGEVPTPYGKIKIKWTKKPDGSIDIDCDAPEKCKRV